MSVPVSTHQYYNQINSARDYVLQHCGSAPIAIVLGSGLMDFVKYMHDSKSVCYADVPYMPMPSVSGHDGNIHVGTLPSIYGDRRIMCFAGRVHAYEGWRPYQVNFISRLASACGVKLMVMTNSAGGSLPGMAPGSIMIIRDHIRMSATNPTRDVCEDQRFGIRHTISEIAYEKSLVQLAESAADKLKMKVLQGTYCWTSGPTYETPCEVQAGITLGAGAFGMSTVPEVLASHNTGMQVFAMSLCTNLAAGLADEYLTHESVKQVALESGPKFQQLLLELFANVSVPEQNGKHAEIDILAQAAAPSAALPMQPYGGWNPSINDIDTGIKLFNAANLSQATPAVALFLHDGAYQAGVAPLILKSLSNVRTLNLIDFAGIKQYSTSFATR